MSRHSTWIWAAAAALAAGGAVHAQGRQPVPVFVDGQRMAEDGLLLKSVHRTVVPMRALFESLGARVEWDSDERAVYAWKPDGKGVRLPLSRLQAETLEMAEAPGPGNWGRMIGRYSLEAPAQLIESKVYVPLRFAAEALKADVRYAAYRPAVHVRTEQVAGFREEEPRRPEPQPDPEPEPEPEPDPTPARDQDDRLSDREFERDRPRDREIDRDARTERLGSALDVRLFLPTQRLKMGSVVTLEMVVRNESDRTVRIPFSSAQQFDLEVLRNNARVWNWAHGRGFAQRLGSITLGPGEETSFEAVWDLRNNRGNSVRPGDYLVRGVLTTSAEQARLTADRTVTVVR